MCRWPSGSRSGGATAPWCSTCSSCSGGAVSGGSLSAKRIMAGGVGTTSGSAWLACGFGGISTLPGVGTLLGQ